MDGSLEQAFSQIDMSLNNKDRKYRELSVLNQFEQDLDRKHAENMQSIAMYSAYEDQVAKFSQSLLHHDQAKIRELHKRKKHKIKELIQQNGGSYAEFMRNGGMQHLVNYKNELVNSEESQRYVKNAENLARIIQARDSGKAALLTARDLKNLEAYEANGGGEITYEGLLSPIQMPPASTYGLGEYMPPEDILKFGNNEYAIRSNYMREFPEAGAPTQQQLIEYTRSKYSGKGSNQAALYANRKKQNNTRTGNKQDKIHYTVMSYARKGLNSMVGANGEGFKITDNLDQIYQRGRSTNRRIFSGNQFTDTSKTVKSGWGWMNDVDNTRPYKSYEFSAFSKSLPTAAKEMYADYYNAEEKGYFFNTSDFHGANGVKLDYADKVKMTPKTVILAPTGRGLSPLSDNQNVDDYFVVEFADDKGNVRKKPTQRYMEEIKDAELKYQPWEVWEDEDGKLYYKKMDLENVSYSQAYKTSINDQNNLDEEIAAEKNLQNRAYRAEAQQVLQQEQNKQTINNFYRSPDFNFAVKQNFKDKNSFKVNDEITNSMVLAFAGAQDKNIDARSINRAFKTLNNIIPNRTYNLLQSPETDMRKVYTSLISELRENEDTDEGKAEVDQFAEYWKLTYEMLTNKKFNLKE